MPWGVTMRESGGQRRLHGFRRELTVFRPAGFMRRRGFERGVGRKEVFEMKSRVLWAVMGVTVVVVVAGGGRGVACAQMHLDLQGTYDLHHDRLVADGSLCPPDRFATRVLHCKDVALLQSTGRMAGLLRAVHVPPHGPICRAHLL